MKFTSLFLTTSTQETFSFLLQNSPVLTTENFTIIQPDSTEITEKATTDTSSPPILVNSSSDLYILGGCSTTGYQFDVGTGAVTSLPVMLKQRNSIESSAAIIDENLFVITPSADAFEIEQLDLPSRQWSKLPTRQARLKPVGIAGVTVVTYKDELYCIGGSSVHPKDPKYLPGDALRTVSKYTPKHGSWIARSDLAFKRANCCCTVYRDYIFVVGGSAAFQYSEVVEFYNPATDTWREVHSRTPFTSPFKVISTLLHPPFGLLLICSSHTNQNKESTILLQLQDQSFASVEDSNDGGEQTTPSFDMENFLSSECKWKTVCLLEGDTCLAACQLSILDHE